MEVDRHVEATAAELASQSKIVHQTGEARTFRDDDHLIEVRIAGDDRRRSRFDQIGQVCVRITMSKCPDNRRRQCDIAEEA